MRKRRGRRGRRGRAEVFVFIRISQCSNQAAAGNMTEELGFHS
jgi:hypothetical protein